MGKKVPDPTNPKETSAATTSTNVATAIANAMMGNVTDITPDGTKTTKQTGSYDWTDPYTKAHYTVPTFTTTQTLSAGQQKIKSEQDRAALNLSTLGANLSDTLGDQLNGNFKLDNSAAEARLSGLARKRLDPMWKQREEDYKQQLANQGIGLNSKAYNRAMTEFNQNRNDDYNQMFLQGRAQADQELLTQDNQRINQISALLNGGQVSQPNWVGANISQIPTTNNASIIANYDQQRMAAAQIDNSFGQSILGGLFGLGSAVISDRRAKKDIHKLGHVPIKPDEPHEPKGGDGDPGDRKTGLYAFNYKGEPSGAPRHVGLMAQEVKKKKPSAVKKTPSGLYAVDYHRALS